MSSAGLQERISNVWVPLMVAFVGAVGGFAVPGFPFEHRLWLTGGAIAFFSILVFWSFGGRKIARIWRVALGLGAGTLLILALWQTLVYHTVRVDYRPTLTESGQFVLFPSRFASDFTLQLYTDQPGLIESVDVKEIGAVRSNPGKVWPHGLANGNWLVIGERVIHPQASLVTYHLRRAAELRVIVESNSPPEIPVLDMVYVDLRVYVFFLTGVALCFVGAFWRQSR